MSIEQPQNILRTDIEQEVKKSFITYAMSVIVSRALPDVRDGLKPVQRRILYAMNEAGNTADRPYRKSAKTVGDVMGNYHPHGDMAIYDALVRMAQDWNLRVPLIDGQGNFGSIDGDPPAAMRYCVTGDTLVVTDQGLVRIDRLSPDGREDVSIRVLSARGVVNTASKWFDSGRWPTRRVVTRYGYEVTGTTNHPLLCWVQGEDGTPDLVWKTIAQIRPGDWLVLDRSEALWPQDPVDITGLHPELPPGSRVERHELPARLDRDLAFLLGALVAEGTVRDQVIEFTNVPGPFAEAFQEAWLRVFPTCRLHVFLREAVGYGRKPFYQMQVVSRQVVTFLRGLGLGGRSAQREIPPAVLQSPQPVAAAFLRGLFEGDGAVERSGRAMLRASLVSASRTLLRQVQTLLLRFGIVSMLRRDESRGTYRLLLVGRRNLQAFAEKIGFVSPAKQEALAQALRTYSGRALSRTDFLPFLSDFVRTRAGRGEREWLSRHNFDRPDRLAEALPRLSRVMAAADLDWIRELAQGTYFFDQVIAVEDAGEHTVYSIRVDSACHSFVANGFVNHNTEARLSRIAGEMLRDIDKDTVDFVDNYDNSLREPVVLPSRFPNLLVNGSSGIAVGMATNIPPHNLGEVIDALFAMIDRPQITSEELMAYVKGPDFPTGALILGRDEIRKAYTTGRGSITLRARAHIEVDRRDRSRILITELPYMVNKAKLIARIAELVREHKIEGITDLRDESDRTGLRIAIEVRRDASARVILNLLYKHTPLQTTFPVHMLALVDGRPRTLNLRDALWHYLQHQKDVIVRRSRFDLKKAEDRAHIVEGLLKALDVIDEVIRTIRESPDTDTARTRLMQRFGFTEVQAQHILDMQLRRLTALERNKLEEEYQELQDRIAYLRAVLASESLQYKIIRQELAEIKEKYADERRTRIVDESGELDVEDLVAQEDIVVTLTHLGYVKRMPVTTYRSQRRGGRGITGATTREEDFVEHLFITTTHHSLMFFTDRGRCFRLKAHEIPEASRTARGTALINLINLEPGEKIQAVIPIRDAEGEGFLFFATRQGYVKKTPLAEYANVRSSGLIAIRLEEGDGVVGVRRTTGQQEIILVSSAGYALRFHEDDVRPMGRDARGVKGIELDEGAAVIGMDVVQPDADLLVATRMAMGKRTPLAEYPTYRRGARGVKTFNLTARTGDLVAIKTVREQSELFLITERGILIRMPAAQVRQTGRIAQGVILMNLEPGDSLVAVAEALTRDDEDGE